METLQLGSSGNSTIQLQNALNALGYGLTVDGQFGTSTKAAVMHFQSTWGLTLDGIVGPETFNAIKTAVAGGTPTPSPVRPAVAIARPSSVVVPSLSAGGITNVLTQYQNYILYGAVGFVGVLVLMKMMKKK